MSERIYIEDRMDAAEHRLAKLEARVNDAVDAAPPKVTLPDLREAINSGRVNVSPVVPNMVQKWDRPDAAPALDDWPGHGIHVSRDAKTGQWLGRVMSPGNADAPALDDKALGAIADLCNRIICRVQTFRDAKTVDVECVELADALLAELARAAKGGGANG